MNRPKTFEDIKGQSWLINYLKINIEKGTLPHFIILEGQEGIGKTSIADLIALNLIYKDSAEYDRVYKEIIVPGRSNDYIKKFNMSAEGGKDAAREVKSELTTTMLQDRPKVVICDECHDLTEQAQDVFLADTEYVKDNVYLIMLTTEVGKLKPSLRSRSVTIHLNPLKQNEMVALLRAEVASKHLKLQNEEAALTMLAEWSECKPRAGLNVLNAFNEGDIIKLQDIQALVGYLDTRDVVPLLSALAGSITFGLSFINEMQVNDSIVNIVIECLTVISGSHSYKLNFQETSYIKEQLSDVTEQQLSKFLYGITKHQHLTKVDLINAFISAHTNFETVVKSDTSDLLNVENIQRANKVMSIESKPVTKGVTLDDLLLNAKVVDD